MSPCLAPWFHHRGPAVERNFPMGKMVDVSASGHFKGIIPTNGRVGLSSSLLVASKASSTNFNRPKDRSPSQRAKTQIGISLVFGPSDSGSRREQGNFQRYPFPPPRRHDACNRKQCLIPKVQAPPPPPALRPQAFSPTESGTDHLKDGCHIAARHHRRFRPVFMIELASPPLPDQSASCLPGALLVETRTSPDHHQHRNNPCSRLARFLTARIPSPVRTQATPWCRQLPWPLGWWQVGVSSNTSRPCKGTSQWRARLGSPTMSIVGDFHAALRVGMRC